MKECNQCGKCCIKYANGGLCATAEEIENWENNYPDIYQYVSNGKIWMDPHNGTQLAVCPWLKQDEKGKYLCSIYFSRPEDCRWYPVSVNEMIRDECEMLENRDLQNLKNTQVKLDTLMSDSRPPLQHK